MASKHKTAVMDSPAATKAVEAMNGVAAAERSRHLAIETALLKLARSESIGPAETLLLDNEGLTGSALGLAIDRVKSIVGARQSAGTEAEIAGARSELSRVESECSAKRAALEEEIRGIEAKIAALDVVRAQAAGPVERFERARQLLDGNAPRHLKAWLAGERHRVALRVAPDLNRNRQRRTMIQGVLRLTWGGIGNNGQRGIEGHWEALCFGAQQAAEPLPKAFANCQHGPNGELVVRESDWNAYCDDLRGEMAGLHEAIEEDEAKLADAMADVDRRYWAELLGADSQ